MKKHTAYILNYILMYMPLIVTAVLLPFLPDKLPMHYNLKGAIDRFGSKYEALLLPVIIILLGYFMLMFARRFAVKEDHGNEKIMLYSNMALMLFESFLQYLSIYKGYRFAVSEGTHSAGSSLLQFTNVALSILIIVLGNLMPKVRRNSAFGLRTVWSTKNDDTWFHSQRISGKILVASGIACLIISCFTPGAVGMLATTVIYVAAAAVSAFISYKIAKKYN